MGIKNLLKFLLEKNNIVETRNINNYYGKKIGIDISILMYQSVISIRNSGFDLTNSDGTLSSHILGIFNKTLKFLDNGIIPIFVFDGKSPLMKQKVLNTRKDIRNKALTKLNNVESDVDKIKYFKRSVWITKEHNDQCRELLNLMGIPYIDAVEEADSELAHLCKNNQVYAVLTEDMDILTFGSPIIIRNLTSFNKPPIHIEIKTILDNLDLTYEQFIELCILFGCDYCYNLTDVKYNEIYNTYIKFKSVDKTIDELKILGYIIPNNFNYIEAKDYFIRSVHKDTEDEKLKLSLPNIEKLNDLLINKYGLINYKINYKINKLLKYYDKFKNI
jgi:flap endonuclease-1